MGRLMDTLRQSGSAAMPGVKEVKDYLRGIDDIPEDNVLRFMLEGDSWVAARPSGTEPKLKIYYSIRAEKKAEAEQRLTLLQAAIRKLVDSES